MTVGELKEILEKYEDNLPVVAFTSDKNYVIDVFIESINVRCLGKQNTMNRRSSQSYYDVETLSGGDEAVLVSIEVPKKF
jgi:hypothetical protein